MKEMKDTRHDVQVKVTRLHPDARFPEYMTPGAACFDLRAVDINGFSVSEHAILNRANVDKTYALVADNDAYWFRTGLAFEIPEGYVMLIFSRSGHGFQYDVRLSNCVGVIDSDYRGEVQVKLRKDNKSGVSFPVKSGDRIAQAMIIPYPRVILVEADHLTETERGDAGFGSTGNG